MEVVENDEVEVHSALLLDSRDPEDALVPESMARMVNGGERLPEDP